MPDPQPRIVLLGNVSPISSLRTVEPLADVDVEELREDPEVHRLTVDEERGLVGIHRRTPIDGTSVTLVSIPADMGLIEGVATAISTYDSDHSDDPPEWVHSDDDMVAAAIADHYNRAGARCAIGAPAGWLGKRKLNSAARLILEALHHGEEETGYVLPRGLRPIGGGSPELDRFMELNGLEALPGGGVRFREEFLRTNAGTDFQARVMGDTASTGTGTYAAANWIALTENAAAPAAADTTLAGELVGSGWTRAQGVYAHTAGAASYTLSKTFTSADATTRTPAKLGIFNAVTVGTMAFESLIPSPPAMVSGDSIAITETVTL